MAPCLGHKGSARTMKIGPIRNQIDFLAISTEGGAGRGRKLIGWNRVNLIVGWFG